MFGLGWPEVVVIGIIALAIFGPKKIPELGGSLGKTLRGFKEELKNPGEENTEENK
jgi:sec-independent protein translocase protein TatA